MAEGSQWLVCREHRGSKFRIPSDGVARTFGQVVDCRPGCPKYSEQAAAERAGGGSQADRLAELIHAEARGLAEKIVEGLAEASREALERMMAGSEGWRGIEGIVGREGLIFEDEQTEGPVGGSESAEERAGGGSGESAEETVGGGLENQQREPAGGVSGNSAEETGGGGSRDSAGRRAGGGFLIAGDISPAGNLMVCSVNTQPEVEWSPDDGCYVFSCDVEQSGWVTDPKEVRDVLRQAYEWAATAHYIHFAPTMYR